jgi:hypothetical protein
MERLLGICFWGGELGGAVEGIGDLMYFVEVMDEHGRGRIFPDLEKGAPYVVVKLVR